MRGARRPCPASHHEEVVRGHRRERGDGGELDGRAGALLFDADGNGAGAAIQFATITPFTPMTSNDFFVV